MNDVFISYSRKDKAFVYDRLRNALEQRGLSVWIDKDDIEPGIDFGKVIFPAIDSADNFLFVISPDSIQSHYCLQELEHALLAGKRILPIVWRSVRVDDLHESLRPLNWISFEEDDFKIALEKLAVAIKTDREVAHDHSRFLVRAQLWVEKGRDSSFCLRGRDLTEALRWLEAALAAERQGKKPVPTPLQIEYIKKSEQRSRRLRAIGVVSVLFVMVLIVVLVFLIGPDILRPILVQPPDLDWVSIDQGTFDMGTNEGSSSERPQHEVYLAAFEIMKFEVTNSDYARCVKAEKCLAPDSIFFRDSAYELHPVVGVSWDDARSFCAWIGARLPTEAEWEKAATWDNARQLKHALVHDANTFEGGPGHTTAIGSYTNSVGPNGLYDMSGNVWEWTSSLFLPYPYVPDSSREDTLASGERVVRGGSFLFPQQIAKATSRVGFDPATRERDLGFRCAREAKTAEEDK